jgi:hypothetical protein
MSAPGVVEANASESSQRVTVAMKATLLISPCPVPVH